MLNPIVRSSLKGMLLIIALANCAAFASVPQPLPTPSPTPGSGVIATIDALSVNGMKANSATASDIELIRAGTTTAAANVEVGTTLVAGDTIRTKEQAQVVLRIPNSQTNVDDLLFVDPKSEIALGSICVLTGRVLAWAGFGFRLCTRRGVLGVEGTEFEVKAEGEDLTVTVYEGKVKPTSELTPRIARISQLAAAVTSGRPARNTNDIVPGRALKLKANGTTEDVEVSVEKRREDVNYWSDQIIKTCKPATPERNDFENFPGIDKAAEFKRARQQALIDNTNDGYLNMAKVLNDWDEGDVAKKSLSKVKETRLTASPEFMLNVALAERSKGNTAAAVIQLERTLKLHRDFADAYYLKAKVTEQKVSSDPEQAASQNEQIRKDLARALYLYSRNGDPTAGVVERDLDQTIKTTGQVSLNKHSWLVRGYEWFGARNQNGWTTIAGNASIKVGERSAIGPAELAISGDQFKLTIADKIFTGRIVGNQNASGITFAMQFDAVTSSDKIKGDSVLTVIGTKYPKGLTLNSVRNPSGSTFTFTTGRLR